MSAHLCTTSYILEDYAKRVLTSIGDYSVSVGDCLHGGLGLWPCAADTHAPLNEVLSLCLGGVVVEGGCGSPPTEESASVWFSGA